MSEQGKIIGNDASIIFENEYNICYSLKPVYSLSTIVGLSKILYVKKKVNYPIMIEVIYSITLFLILLITFFNGFVKSMNNYFGKEILLIVIVEILLDFTGIIIALISIVRSIIKRKTHMKYIENMKEIDRHLMIKNDLHKKFHAYFMIIILVWFLYIITMSVTDYLTWINNGNLLQFWLYFYVIILDITILNYVCEVLLVISRFKQIKLHLQLMNQVGNLDEYRFTFIESVKSRNENNEYFYKDNCDGLFKIMKSCEKLMNNLQLINNFYGLQVNKHSNIVGIFFDIFHPS